MLERLRGLVDPAVAHLARMMNSEETDDALRTRIAQDLLDRTGFKPTDKLKLSGDANEPLEIVISRVVASPPN